MFYRAFALHIRRKSALYVPYVVRTNHAAAWEAGEVESLSARIQGSWSHHGGDKGIPYRLDTNGLYPAPDVTVSPETKVGFNLRSIRGGEDLERFEELLGIR